MNAGQHSGPKSRWALPGLAFAFVLASAGAGLAQTIEENLWVTNGEVDAVLRDKKTIYIGGVFSHVGPATGAGVPIDASTAALPGSFPKVAGRLYAVVSDGAGGWYIGGRFNAVGGLPRSNLAHVAADLTVSAWNPDADGIVRAIAVSGSKVYAGGDFSSIGGEARNGIAALDATSAVATDWDPNADGQVYAIVVSGIGVYVAGSFTVIGGQARSFIANLDPTTGAATAWNPAADNRVNALAVNGSRVYAGGVFHAIGGQPRNYIAALDRTTGLAIGWNPNANSEVMALVANASTVYAGGVFTAIGGQSRGYIAALSATTGEATAWDPDANTIVLTVAVSGTKVYIGGYFTTVRGQARNHIAAIDATTGAPTAWDPNANHNVWAIAVSGTTVYAGGQFTSVGGAGVTRHNIAALDELTGAATSWNPNADGGVGALAIYKGLSGTMVLAGGSFTQIGGQARNFVAGLDLLSGAATSWNPDADGPVNALAVGRMPGAVVGDSISAIYVGGNFSSIGGASRNYIAAVDSVLGGAFFDFDAGANSFVNALAVTGGIVYAGGNFTSIGGQSRHYVASLDARTGAAAAWDPNASNDVRALLVSGPVVYVGGDFYSIGGASGCLAAIDARTGIATAFNPGVNNTVRAIAAINSTVYAGGDFFFAGGQPRNGIVALDAETGAATAWDPNPDAVVRALLATGPIVYAGGDFNSMAAQAACGIAGIRAAPDVRGVQPSTGGNSGAITVTIVGYNLQDGATAMLSGSAGPDIPASFVAASADERSLTATFDLDGAAVGARNVVVSNPDGQTDSRLGGFTITVVEGPQLRVGVIGPALIRSSRRTSFDLVIENPGNIDALAVPLWISGVPPGATLELDFALAAPPQAGGEPDWSTVPLGFTSPGGRYLPVVIPRVPPGTMVRRIFLTIPTGVPTFQLGAALTPPWVDGNKFRACLSAGGVITAPACMGAQLTAINAFLANNPQLQALSGIGVWAKIAWQCEGSTTLPAALVKAEQILDYMVQPIEVPGSAIGACSDVLPPRWRDSLLVTIVGSIDPNDKIGFHGALALHQAIPYSIRFENSSTATAPAQQVVISDALDLAKLDASTVSLDVITFGNVHIVPPPGLKSYATQVDLRPARNLLVNVSAGLDPFTGVLTWYFSSIDPLTGQPPTNPLSGFLPPNQTPPQGEGSVLFTVMPRSTLASGAQISNAATITFDDNPPVTTATWLNTLDAAPPASQVMPLAPTSNQPSVPVQWTASGSPPDLRDYTVYVSEDGGPYRVWRLNTTAVNDTLVPPANHVAHTYAFYSVARDIHGNIEPPPGAADATTQATTAVGDGESLQLALAGARPNPARGTLAVWFTLPSREPATLEVLDVAGRRVMRRDVGELGPGSHHVTLGNAPQLRPGLYFLKLTQASRSLSSRVVVVR